ncbi:MAG: acetyl-CoA C-acyltransferase [Candidatus Methylomirabilis oxygeniifera]|uniref:acetyl-CoA C-acyltransferase n=1 Tax=Methylomirabilis oxygeniifera TaxID=671143 RepID=D5MEV9_METO1|nr:MAG: acetyl-CoA C-acyltransferase [Candidatus Methylomirabilis oxyfera]CBE68288.1 Acetyl-CoA acetyltransferase with thiolase domain (Acetoacetyl-CoA thiolase) [Candidatus Methylomirabilis oxyfera]
MKEAVIVAAARTAVGKAPRGTLCATPPVTMAATVIGDLLKRTPALAPEEIEDVIIGCAFPEAEQGMNMARVAALRAGLPYTVPGQTVNRFCSSGLQTIAIAAERIMAGFADVIIAGGAESMSLVPMSGNTYAPDPYLAEQYPAVYISMGNSAENLVQAYKVSREDQDRFALESHLKAAAAIRTGRFKDEIVPLTVTKKTFRSEGTPSVATDEVIFDCDEGVRFDTSAEALAKLPSVFHKNGTVTAGNSSQTSDGAAAVLVISREKAQQLGLKPLAIFRAFAVAGVPPDLMGIGPVEAIPKALKLAGLTIDQIDLIELNEAFAAQALAVIRKLGLPLERVNVNGGAIALGHPLGCSGAKLTATLLHEMQRRQARYGMVTMCIGGGMGAAGIFERVTR